MDTEATAAGDDGVARPIGQLLGAARRARGLDLTDIARDTRVPARHLAAIEADAHDNLPALPYTIGFVKAFARAVGLDPDMAAANFRAETNKAAHVPVAPAMIPVDERRLPPRGVITASLAALVAVVLAVVAWSAGMFDRAPPPAVVAVVPVAPPVIGAAPLPAAGPGPVATTAAVPPAAAPTPVGAVPVTTAPTRTVAALPTPAAALPGPAALPAAAGSVVITANEDAWFKVSAFDRAVGKVVTVKTGVLAKGERYVPPPTPGLRLWTGRAGALAITVDGRQIPPLGGPVETVKNVSLDPADLRARLVSNGVPAPGRAGPPVG